MIARNLPLLFFVTLAHTLLAQTEVPAPPSADKIYEQNEWTKAPAFPGGESKMYAFIGKNLNYPTVARERNIKGKVVISFVVDKQGKLRDFVKLNDIGGGCADEALRVAKAMPDWIPAEWNGKAVNSRYSLPITYRIH